MKKLALFVCLLVVTVAAQAQFEKGKWILNPSITGLEFSHDTGTNHVLPTSGTAKFYSPLGVYDFMKVSCYSYYPKEVLETFKEDVVEFANREGLSAHANSLKVRF
jgi:hypothetical protein